MDKKENVFFYNNDKNGWVVSKKSKSKVKLRKYISDLARDLVRFNKKTYKETRNLLIGYYNLGGLEYLNKGYLINYNECLTNIKKQIIDETDKKENVQK